MADSQSHMADSQSHMADRQSHMADSLGHMADSLGHMADSQVSNGIQRPRMSPVAQKNGTSETVESANESGQATHTRTLQSMHEAESQVIITILCQLSYFLLSSSSFMTYLSVLILLHCWKSRVVALEKNLRSSAIYLSLPRFTSNLLHFFSPILHP